MASLENKKTGWSEWSEVNTCDRCGAKDKWGVEFWSKTMEDKDETCQLCHMCLEEMAAKYGEY